MSKMKSSKYTQATSSPNDNEYRDYQNIGITRLQDDGNKNNELTQYIETHCLSSNTSSELLLKSNHEAFKTEESLHEIQRYSPERNANKTVGQQDIEMVCNCAVKNVVYPPKTIRYKDHYSSEQNMALNRSLASLPKLESTNLSQHSLDRKAGGKFHTSSTSSSRQKHTYVCDQNRKILQRMERNSSIKRVQSPEIINIHRGPNSVIYDGYGTDNCAIKSCVYDKAFKCDDYGFMRGQSFRTSSSRSNVSHSHPKRQRAAGDGMDAEMDDPELMFELTEHLGDCQCACDHVVYTPGYTTCLQIVGPAFLEILHVDKCLQPVDQNLEINLDLRKIKGKKQYVSGTLNLPYDIDEKVLITLTGYDSVDNSLSAERKYINKKSFCRIIDNYLFEHYDVRTNNSIRTFCPIAAGIYDIPNVSPTFNELNFPYEMLGYKKYQLELIKDDKVIACNIFHMNNIAQNTEYL